MRKTCPGGVITSSRTRLLLSLSIVASLVSVAALVVGRKMGYALDFRTPLSFRPPLKVDFIPSGMDRNGNGIDDLLDIVAGARKQVNLRPVYRSDYYEGGYPPDDEGVCTDLIWRALRCAGHDLKQAVDRDIAEATPSYPEVHGKPDPNIDFRWVPNLYVFFSRSGQTLTTEVKPWDRRNLSEWQPGDIVVFGSGYDHIGIVSDKRRRDGVPLVIHHGWACPVEDDILRYWGDRITGHFRMDLKQISGHTNPQ